MFATVRRDAPSSLLAITAAGIVIANVVVAQALIRALAPGSGYQLGTAVMVALTIVTLGCMVYAVRGWRSYVRGEPDRRPDRPGASQEREGEAR